MVYAWGQFIDHDVDLTAGLADRGIRCPGPARRPAVRSRRHRRPDHPVWSLRIGGRHRNESLEPAPAAERHHRLPRRVADLRIEPGDRRCPADVHRRTGEDQSRALWRHAAGQQPGDLSERHPAHGQRCPSRSEDQLFAAGDVRANENIELTGLQTLFVREHNRIGRRDRAVHPRWKTMSRSTRVHEQW